MKYWFLSFTRLTSPQICKISWQERRHIAISSSVKVDGLKIHWESVLHCECKVNREAWPHYEGSQTGRILLYSGICGGWFCQLDWIEKWLGNWRTSLGDWGCLQRRLTRQGKVNHIHRLDLVGWEQKRESQQMWPQAFYFIAIEYLDTWSKIFCESVWGWH